MNGQGMECPFAIGFRIYTCEEDGISGWGREKDRERALPHPLSS